METVIRNLNPWWRGERLAGLPSMRRWAFEPLFRHARQGLTPAAILRGPRQIGKTTLFNQIVENLLEEGFDPKRIFRLQFDELPGLRRLEMPLIELAAWYEREILRTTLTRAANEGKPALLVLDEVQNLADWAPQLKHLLDVCRVRALVTGSSALRIEEGRDSLAGRITTYEMGPLLLREIAELRGFDKTPPFLPLNGLGPLKQIDFWRELRSFGEKHRQTRQAAFAAFSARGAYPVAHAFPAEPWERLADLLNETVIRRAIQHDLRLGPRGQKRDQHLLEEVFRLTCRYLGQSPAQRLYLAELRQAMNANVGWQRILAYLKFLDNTLLIRLIEPMELRLKRRRSGYKLSLCDHALRAAWLQEVVPLAEGDLQAAPHLAELAGRVAESVVGYFLRSIVNLDVAYFPERPSEPEVDFVITIGDQRIPIEVKYRRRIDFEDTRGVRSFLEKPHYNAPFGVLVSLLDDPASDDPRIISLPLSTLLLMR